MVRENGNLWLTYLSIALAVTFVNSQNAVVILDIGGQEVNVHGIEEKIQFDSNNYTLHKYLGIPFAQPPVGDLRFRRPEPIQRMESPFNATNFGMACVQLYSLFAFNQSEDCLYLNVYVPGRPADSSSGHAVGVWVHGGGFTEGAANYFDGSFLSLYGNVIIVTINYRLGIFGSLSTGDDDAPGNIAFWDQHLAFQWVKDNIGQFGGDIDRVTIFGESAGATSVSVQGLAPLNRDLFQRVIAQSGSANVPIGFTLDSNPIEYAIKVGELLGCDQSTTMLLMNCLRQVSHEDITKSLLENDGSPYFPYVLDELITHEFTTIPIMVDDTSRDEVEFYRSLDVMNGFNSHEGVFGIDYIKPGEVDNFTINVVEMKTALNDMFMLGLDESVLEMMMHEYTDWNNPRDQEMRLQFIKLLGDFTFGAPAVETGRMHALSKSSARNYMYYFSANPSFGVIETPDWVPGANHADEIFFMFGIETETEMLDKDPNTTWEIQLSRKMITYWTNFMKSGNPNSPEQVSPAWPEYNIDLQTYLTLEENTTDKSVGQFLLAKESNFWNHVYRDINMAMDKKDHSEAGCVSSALRTVSTSVFPFIISVLLFY
ncbi:Cocaine esterase [Mactra antiquata]